MKNGPLCKGKRHPAGMYAPAGLMVAGAVVWVVGSLTMGVDVILHIMAMAAILVGGTGVVSVAMDIAGFSLDAYADRIVIKRGALLARGVTEIRPQSIVQIQVDRSWLIRLVAPSAGVITISLQDGRSGTLPLMINADQLASTIRGLASVSHKDQSDAT